MQISVNIPELGEFATAIYQLADALRYSADAHSRSISRATIEAPAVVETPAAKRHKKGRMAEQELETAAAPELKPTTYPQPVIEPAIIPEPEPQPEQEAVEEPQPEAEQAPAPIPEAEPAPVVAEKATSEKTVTFEEVQNAAYAFVKVKTRDDLVVVLNALGVNKLPEVKDRPELYTQALALFGGV